MEGSGQLHTLAALLPEKEPLDGLQSSPGRCEVEKNLFPLSEIELLPPSPQAVAIPTELSQKKR
jgi:hypothetical protein